jgi:hypothetical protein
LANQTYPQGSAVARGLRDASLAATPDTSRRDVQERRVCGWCQTSIRAAARRDSKYCGQRCRQAAHRFHVPSRRAGAAAQVSGLEPRRFAYADPPYPGLARRYYADHEDFAGEVDHRELIARLVAEYPDGWALSTSAAALPSLLPACPTGVRVAAWFRGERPTASYSPLVAWEPVIYFGGRRYLSSGSARRVDALVHVARARLTDPRRVIGAKPAAFCAWLFQLLGATAADEFVDLFPGSGGVALSWETVSLGRPRRVVLRGRRHVARRSCRDRSRPPGRRASPWDPRATTLAVHLG